MGNKIKLIKILKKLAYIAIFFDNKIRKQVIWDLNCKLIRLLQEKYTKKYPDDYIIFSRNGAGDVFFVASLLYEFKKNHQGKIIYLTDKPKLKNFIETFASIDEVIADKDTKLFQIYAPVQRKIKKGQVNFLYFPYRGTKENYVFADSYANLLGVNINSKRELPQITEEHIKNAHQEYEKLNLTPGKTIILIPESVMFDHRILSPKFWKTLANMLKRQGYDVVINSSNKAYKNYKTTFLPIPEFIEFSKNARHIISFRSGICDVLTGCDIYNITSIYPKNLEVIWANKFMFDELLNKYHRQLFETEFENIFHIYSLNSNFKTTKINEIIFNNDENKLIECIMKQLTSNEKDSKIEEWI